MPPTLHAPTGYASASTANRVLFAYFIAFLASAPCMACKSGNDASFAATAAPAQPETAQSETTRPTQPTELPQGPVAVPTRTQPLTVPAPDDAPLIISEVVASNDGVAIDEQGETDDYIELTNRGPSPLALEAYRLQDMSGNEATLPAETIAPGAVILLWADDDPEQGSHHLPIKLSATADFIHLLEADRLVQKVPLQNLATNEALMWFEGEGSLQRCRYTSPGKPNENRCAPPPPPMLADETFAPFTWPQAVAPTGLAISELALKPANFVELHNRSASPVTLADYALRLSAHAPGQSWPGPSAGDALALPEGAILEPGERLVIPVAPAQTAAVGARPEFEGVLTLFARATGEVRDRVDFMQWPDGASLARLEEDESALRFCITPTPQAPNACEEVSSREVGNRIRHLRTAGDFAALSAGASEQGIASVKWVLDLSAGGVVHLLSSSWALHYSFVRKEIYAEPDLDRCDPTERNAFDAGWYAFSESEYFATTGRRFLLGTLSHYPGSGIHAVEYTPGDNITPSQMLDGFTGITGHTYAPQAWALRPQSPEQVVRARSIEGMLPIVGENAPFIDVRYQGLTEGVGYGTLRFIAAEALHQQPLGPQVIVLTDEVPNDIPFVGGLITEAFQTPLAHVNVLSQGRNTPNMALPSARSDTRVAPFLDKLVKLEVDSNGFTLAEADPAEAQAFWQAQTPERQPYSPEVDTSLRALLDLDGSTGLAGLPAIGAKAAQLDELSRVASTEASCGIELKRPDSPFAIPVVHYIEHLKRSGASELLSQHLADSAFLTDPLVRRPILAEVRQRILDTPVDSALLMTLDDAIALRFGQRRIRFRSSSNVEDLATFSGAGIYTSASAERGEPERPIDGALRTVWASLWDERAFDERQFAQVDHSQVAMGVLVHPAFRSEKANGVGISRNVHNPERGDQFYYNLQFGEASVTNPAPGVTTEQVVVQRPPRTASFMYEAQSSLAPGHVMTDEELGALSCVLATIHTHFKDLLDPADNKPWFAVEIEFKLMDEARQLFIKQARPYSFGAAKPVGDCREL